MYSVWVFSILGLVVVIWLVFLTIQLFRQQRFLVSLFPSSGERDIRNKFKELTNLIAGFNQKELEINLKIDQIKKDSLKNIQKVSILRYNPYKDTGGDQSFSVVLLNKELTGVVITSLHSRAGTRVYVKNIVEGKSDLDLSKEELEVLKKITKE